MGLSDYRKRRTPDPGTCEWRPANPVPRHLEVEAPLPQHLRVGPPRHPKLLRPVQSPQLERLGLLEHSKHPQDLRPRRRHLLGRPLRLVLAQDTDQLSGGGAELGGLCDRDPGRARSPGNSITQKAQGSGGGTLPVRRRRPPRDSITQKARGSGGGETPALCAGAAQPGLSGCHESGGRGPGPGRRRLGLLLGGHRRYGSEVRAGPGRWRRCRLSSGRRC